MYHRFGLTFARFPVLARTRLIALCLALTSSAALHAQSNYATPYAFTTIAGVSPQGTTDGPGPAARFNLPFGTAVDASGNVYVADTHNFTIRKITAAGVVTTLAGSPGLAGTADGTGSAARFGRCWGVAVDASGNVYVTDSLNHTIRKITPAGAVTTLAGSAGVAGSVDNTGTAARFNQPTGIAVDGTGTLYVSDQGNNTVRRITAAGVVTTFAGTAGSSGSANGTGSVARFNGPAGIGIDGSGNVFVADNRTVRRITPAGVVTTLAGLAGTGGSVDATGSAARFRFLSGLGVDTAGNVYVSDEENASIRKITPAGVVSTLAGTTMAYGSTDNVGPAARFATPEGVAVDASGNLYVADALASTIRKITPAGAVSTLAGLAGGFGAVDGSGSAARFGAPGWLTVDGGGNIYVSDNNTVRRISSAGIVTTLAGTAGVTPSFAQGNGAAARFDEMAGLAVDAGGNVFVADANNRVIRRVTPAGVVTTVAGSPGIYATTDGVGSAARFQNPLGIALDATGNLFVADQDAQTIRLITPAGAVSTFAGSTTGVSGSADGVGNAARFSEPTAVAVDSSGNVYVGDLGNNTVRKITPGRVVTTLAGLAGTRGSADGTGSNARFTGIVSLAVDGAGNIYVGDGDTTEPTSFNYTIRKITPAGVVTTLGGTVGIPGAADGVGPAARFTRPWGLAAEANGTIYVSDAAAHTIRRGVQVIDPPVITTQPTALALIAGTPASFTVTAASTVTPTYQWRKDGTNIAGATNVTFAIATTQVTDSGSYTVVVTNPGGAVTSSAATLTVARNFAGTYFGTFDGNRGSWSLVVRNDQVGTFVGFLNNPRSGIVATVTVLPDGTFRTDSALIQPASTPQVPGSRTVAAASTPFTLTGTIGTSAVTGSLVGVGVSFAGTVDGTAATASPFAGIYQAANAAAATTTYTVVGNSGRTMLALTIGPTLIDGATGTLATNGTFTVTTPDNTRINGTLVPATGGITGTITPATGPAINVTGAATNGLGAPVLASQPAPQTVIAGASVTLTLTVGGKTPLTYQWKKDGTNIAGATAATFSIAVAQIADAGSYTCLVTNSDGSITSAPAALTVAASARIVNLSILTDLPTAGSNFTLGYVVGGAGTNGAPKPLVIRAVGPSLGALGVSGTLDDPKFELFTGSTKTGENDNWGGASSLTSAIAAVGAFPFTGPTSRDAATLANITTSNNSVLVSAAGNGTGTVIAEVYDATPNDAYTATTPRLVNVSVLKQIGSGFTVGFVIGGSGGKTVLIRAIGPGLAGVGVASGFLADPRLTLFAGSTQTAENNDWAGTPALTAAMAQNGAFAIPAASRDAALLTTLQPGSYSARVDGPAATTGLVLVEIYELP